MDVSKYRPIAHKHEAATYNTVTDAQTRGTAHQHTSSQA